MYIHPKVNYSILSDAKIDGCVLYLFPNVLKFNKLKEFYLLPLNMKYDEEKIYNLILKKRCIFEFSFRLVTIKNDYYILIGLLSESEFNFKSYIYNNFKFNIKSIKVNKDIIDKLIWKRVLTPCIKFTTISTKCKLCNSVLYYGNICLNKKCDNLFKRFDEKKIILINNKKETVSKFDDSVTYNVIPLKLK